MICHKKFPVSPIGLNYFYTIGMNTNLWWCFITRCEHCLIFMCYVCLPFAIVQRITFLC